MSKLSSLLLILIGASLFSGCKKEVTLPIVSTSSVINITGTTATSGGTIVYDGGESLTACGVCWDISANPTTEDSKTSDEISLGQFVSNITGLSEGLTYHVRAYATNSAGTAYGADFVFSTQGESPECITLPATEIWQNTATLNGAVNPNYLSTAVTFEYGTSTIYGTLVNASTSPIVGSELINVYANLEGLVPGTTYHFRIKTVNTLGTSYGGDMVFTTAGNLAIPTAGLVAYYPFNGNVNDESGNGHHGTPFNPLQTVDRFGKSNSAVGFDGYTGVERYIQANIGLLQTVSFCAWFKSVNPDTYYPTIMHYGTQSIGPSMGIAGDHGDYIKRGIVGTVGIGFRSAAPATWVTGLASSKKYADSEWHFLVAIFVPNDKCYLYIDNEFAGEDLYGSSLVVDEDRLIIGREIDDNAAGDWHETHFNGSIDDIRIFNRKLTPNEIQSLYREGGYQN
jgi:hypothetical protein